MGTKPKKERKQRVVKEKIFTVSYLGKVIDTSVCAKTKRGAIRKVINSKSFKAEEWGV